MSSPASAAETAAPSDAADDSAPAGPDGWRDNNSHALATLRVELDRIDDALHDLLMERGRVIEEVARSGKRTALRPGRQAAIIRRLLARHQGALPAIVVVRIWLELLAGTTAMQEPFAVAVCAPGGDPGYVQIAREHFGALTPLRVHRSPAHAIGEVSAGMASIAVLPMPSETEAARDAWWTALLQKGEPRIHVVARLPFWRPRAEGAPDVQALVVALAPPDPSGVDRSLLGVELALDVSRARLTAALANAGLEPAATILRRDSGAPVADALVEVAGYLGEDDPRLGAISVALRHPVVLGAYAVPLEGAPA
jgi:chorismate mutase / prephenate dehydratase